MLKIFFPSSGGGRGSDTHSGQVQQDIVNSPSQTLPPAIVVPKGLINERNKKSFMNIVSWENNLVT